MDRHIIYFGIDGFPIEVERVRDRRLAGRPVALIPSSGARAVVAAVSAEARSEGVREGMALTLAKRYCPKLQIILPDPALYQRAQDAALHILGDYSPLIEPEGYGRIYLDLTGTRRLFGDAKDVGAKMRKEVNERLRLTGDLGLATNKLVSRVAGELAHAGIWDVLPGSEAAFLSPLPPWLLPGVGALTARRLLEELNLRTVGQVAAVDPAHLRMAFGALGAILAQRARGIDPRPVLPPARVPEATADMLLGSDTNDELQLEAALWQLAERLGAHLRSLGKVALELKLTARFSDGRDATRTLRLSCFTNLDLELAEHLVELGRRLFERRVRVRYVRAAAPRLEEENLQRDLFGVEPEREKLRALHGALDRLRGKYGLDSIKWGKVALAEQLRDISQTEDKN